jgi:N-acetylmuramoyl-L-alanine amidase
MGASALNTDQLTAWFAAQGYDDLTSTTITKLATWYLVDGAKEGVRGDVGFAQAVLETGGFSSPDAVGLNNYAGIGHCDQCGQGWRFPSPEAGVIGQLQLLRIFASGEIAPKPAPPPVLPALTPSKQGRRACCTTWESLTGVWASDPLYGVQILTMYAQMLDLATASPPRPPGT